MHSPQNDYSKFLITTITFNLIFILITTLHLEHHLVSGIVHKMKIQQYFLNKPFFFFTQLKAALSCCVWAGPVSFALPSASGTETVELPPLPATVSWLLINDFEKRLPAEAWSAATPASAAATVRWTTRNGAKRAEI